MKQRLRVNTTGFSLIELLVFMMIVAVFSTTVIRLGNLQTVDVTEKIYQAHLLQKGQAFLDQLTSTSYSKITLSNQEVFTDAEGLNYTISVIYQGREFQLPQQEVKFISLSVSGIDSSPVILSTYRFDY